MIEVLLDEGSNYSINKQKVNLYSVDVTDGYHTVAEIDGIFYQLGNMEPDIMAAMFAYQKLNNYTFSQEQIDNILNENSSKRRIAKEV